MRARLQIAAGVHQKDDLGNLFLARYTPLEELLGAGFLAALDPLGATRAELRRAYPREFDEAAGRLWFGAMEWGDLELSLTFAGDRVAAWRLRFAEDESPLARRAGRALAARVLLRAPPEARGYREIGLANGARAAFWRGPDAWSIEISRR